MALITRRTAILAGLASAGGLVLAKRFPKELPPTYGSLLRMGDSFTYGMQRALLPGQSLVREYSYKDVSSFPAIGTTDPVALNLPGLSDAFARLQRGAFADYRLPVEGRVARPQAFSLADLKRLPARTQITKHTCEEGWTAIAEWTGVSLARALDAAGILPTARFVVFHTWDDGIDSIDMIDALHPQTLLAYGMNGRDLPLRHGAPVRLRVEHQMGYRSFKYLKRIVVSDTFESGGKKGAVENGWAWYTGI
jgi:DMSO/TMAO reductase YedYZ molybdopterin-dependent catalytic subunit